MQPPIETTITDEPKATISSSEPETEADDRNIVRRFFFPLRNQKNHRQLYSPRWSRQRRSGDERHPVTSPSSPASSSVRSLDSSSSYVGAIGAPSTAKEDVRFVNSFWTTYDDLLILSIFTQLGILFRLAVSTWLTFFDSAFSKDSALFVNLPLNCLSCFIMGALCSGERLMEVIATRFSPSHTQQQLQRTGDYVKSQIPTDDESCDDDREMMVIGSSVTVNMRDDDDDDNNHSDQDGDNDDDEVHSSKVPARPPRGLFQRRGGRGRHRVPNSDGCDDDDRVTSRGKSNRYTRRLKRQKTRRPTADAADACTSWEPALMLNNELRDVQLLALERRIRMSKCLLLFPAEQQDVDVMEHYFHSGYKKDSRHAAHDSNEHSSNYYNNTSHKSNVEMRGKNSPNRSTGINDRSLTSAIGGDLELREIRSKKVVLSRDNDPESGPVIKSDKGNSSSRVASPQAGRSGDKSPSDYAETNSVASSEQPPVEVAVPDGSDENPLSDGESAANSEHAADNATAAPGVDQIITDVTTNVTENISRLRRVNLADGWDAGTSPDAMSDDLLLGLRAGFCGALSSFSSWNSAMANLLLSRNYGQAIVGYMLGLQLPIIAYRFGQHVAVYAFVWRARRQARRAERGGYGLKLSQNDDSDHLDDDEDDQSVMSAKKPKDDREIPSVRAFVTAIFIMALVTQCTSLYFFQEHQQLSLSLLFSPLGVFARWRLMKWNNWRRDFPVGTFTANILACALGGSIGSLLAGNPGPEEAIVLVSIISGFGGTLSSVGAFIEEILSGIDPILLRIDGITYAIISIISALVVVLICSTSADWADQVGWNSAADSDSMFDGSNTSSVFNGTSLDNSTFLDGLGNISSASPPNRSFFF